MPLSGIHVLVTGFPINTFGNDKCPWRPTGLLCAYWCFVSKPVREPFDTSGLRRELSRTINSAKDPMINHEPSVALLLQDDAMRQIYPRSNWRGNIWASSRNYRVK